MKEVFRIENGSFGDRMVRQLNLEIYAGEIVLLCGQAGSGILTLRSFLNGKCALEQGRIYIDGEPAGPGRDASPAWRRIFVNTAGRNQAGNLTVVENLHILTHPNQPLRIFHQARAERAAETLLRAEGVEMNPAARVDRLTERQRQMLNLVQARVSQAGLFVIDATRSDLANSDDTEIYEMTLRLKREGMAFLILAFHPRHFIRYADRYVLMEQGRDTWEWQRGRFETEFPGAGPRANIRKIAGEAEAVVDPWEYELSEGELLRCLRDTCPAYWREHLHFSVPRRGLCSEKGTVLIPKESAVTLARNLSIRENLALPLRRRAGKTPLGIWQENAVASIHQEFCRRTGTDPEKRTIRDLSLLERKLLSIYRWEIDRPDVMVLHGIYYGLDSSEIERLNEYIAGMQRADLRIIICAGSGRETPLLCASGTESTYGKDPHYVRYES